VKKPIIAFILLIVNALPVAVLGLSLYTAAEGAFGRGGYVDEVVRVLPQEGHGPGSEGLQHLGFQNKKSTKVSLIGALGAVVVIFLLTVVVLWLLSKIGGPLQADVKASMSKFGGRITITAAAIVGAFLAISIVGVSAVYVLIN
jgi:hypothetical protein